MYQVQQTESNNVTLNTSKNEYIYEDSVVVIKYDLWSRGGSLTFSIYNKTNNALYIDWNKSNFIYNGYSNDYLKNTTTILSSSSGSYNNGLSNSNSVSFVSKDKPQVQLPPRSYIIVHKFNLNRSTTFTDKDEFRESKKRITKYTHDSTIFKFRNYLAISKNEDYSKPFFVDNDFWLANVTNYEKTDFTNLKKVPDSFYASKRIKDIRKVRIGTVIGIGLPASYFLLVLIANRH